jgi:hypothetical protein
MAAALTKEETNYRVADDYRKCGNCAMFKRLEGACTLVKGTIRAMDTCDRWEAKKK